MFSLLKQCACALYKASKILHLPQLTERQQNGDTSWYGFHTLFRVSKATIITFCTGLNVETVIDL